MASGPRYPRARRQIGRKLTRDEHADRPDPEELGASSYDKIEIWRQGPFGSASHAVASENADRDAVDPSYGARFEGIEKLLSPFDYERLAQAGAVEIRKPIPGAL